MVALYPRNLVYLPDNQGLWQIFTKAFERTQNCPMCCPIVQKRHERHRLEGYQTHFYFLILIFFIFLPHDLWNLRVPDQGLNLGPCSENAES